MHSLAQERRRVVNKYQKSLPFFQVYTTHTHATTTTPLTVDLTLDIPIIASQRIETINI